MIVNLDKIITDNDIYYLKKIIYNLDQGDIDFIFYKSSLDGKKEIVEYILSDINIHPKNFEYVWEQIINNNQIDIVKLFITYGVIDILEDRNLEYAIEIVAYNGFNDMLKLLLELDRIDVNFKNYLPLRSAIECDRLDTLNILLNSDKLELKLDNSYKLVHYALMYDKFEISEYLLKNPIILKSTISSKDKMRQSIMESIIINLSNIKNPIFNYCYKNHINLEKLIDKLKNINNLENDRDKFELLKIMKFIKDNYIIDSIIDIGIDNGK